MNDPIKTILILSLSSDIGQFLARKHLSLGHRVIGTYRSDAGLGDLKGHPHCRLFLCDVHDRAQLASFAQGIKAAGINWDTFISCVGHPLPLTSFLHSNIDEWQSSVEVNSLDQLRAFHMVHPFRRKGGDVNAVFFAAGGVNNAVVNLSAYTIGKIVLTKMCEFIAAEEKDLNIFIVGPGWTKTKVHATILNAPNVSQAKADETRTFLAEKEGTPLEEIFDCIDWLCKEGKAIASGRNFSVVYDPWRPLTRVQLAAQLKADSDMYKLRRHKNDFMQVRNT